MLHFCSKLHKWQPGCHLLFLSVACQPHFVVKNLRKTISKDGDEKKLLKNLKKKNLNNEFKMKDDLRFFLLDLAMRNYQFGLDNCL